MKFRFATDQEGNISDVNDLQRETVDRKKKYFTIDTGDLLIPRLGKIKRKHFALKSAKDYLGSKETYLHNASKLIIYNNYENAIKNNTPYYHTWERETICTKFIEDGVQCMRTALSNFDLTTRYREIRLEKKDGDFIPDLLLVDSKSDKNIYIEVAVTHKSSAKKISSGIRIIEIEIQDEKDLAVAMKFGNDDYIKNQTRYNFMDIPTQSHNCKGEPCPNYLLATFAFKSGKSIVIEDDITPDFIETIKEYKKRSTWSRFNVIEGKPCLGDCCIPKRYLSEIQSALYHNAPIESCLKCRYHGGGFSKIYCKFLRRDVRSNQAVDCKYYRIPKQV